MKYTKVSHITTTDEVKEFVHHVRYDKKLIFHPDDPLNNFTEEELKEMNLTPDEVLNYERLLDECFEVCERENEDIYDIFLDEYMPIFNEEMEELIK